MQADPLDGYSLFALFVEPEPIDAEDEWEWEAEPVVWQRIADEDPLDYSSLCYLFREEVQQGPDLMDPRPYFQLLRDDIVDAHRENVDFFERAISGAMFQTQQCIIDGSLP